MAVMLNNKPNLLRMDSLKRYDAYDIMTSMIMVGSQHSELLKAAAAEGKSASFRATDLQASTWQQLRNDVLQEQWPLDQKERQDMFKSLHAAHAASQDRLDFLISAFKAVEPDADAFLAALSKDN